MKNNSNPSNTKLCDDELIEVLIENSHGHKIDWSYWFGLPFWEPEEAIYLINLSDPKVRDKHQIILNDNSPYYRDTLNEIERIQKQITLAIREQKTGILPKDITPIHWLNWAIKKDIRIPSQFDQFLQKPRSIESLSGKGLENNKQLGYLPDGKQPNTSIGKLAIKAAYEIETKLKRRATAKEVIEELRAWSKNGIYPDVLHKTSYPNRGVYWMTISSKEKEYSLEACGAALKIWNKSRA